MEGVFVIFLFAGVIAITALLFGVWIVVGILRLIIRGVAAIFVAPRPRSLRPLVQNGANQTIQCASNACRATNPATARFCRRCGQAVPAAQRVAATRCRAACW